MTSFGGYLPLKALLPDGALLLPYLDVKEILTRYRVVDLPTAQAPRGPHI